MILSAICLLLIGLTEGAVCCLLLVGCSWWGCGPASSRAAAFSVDHACGHLALLPLMHLQQKGEGEVEGGWSTRCEYSACVSCIFV